MQSFDVSGPLRAAIRVPAGEVTVSTHDAPQAEVEVTALKNDEATLDAVARTVVELRPYRDGHELVVEVPKRAGSLFGREVRIRAALLVPHGTDVVFTTASANVRVTGRPGEVQGRTASGDVTVDAAASLELETASGDLRVGDVAGAADVKAASGDVTLGRVAGVLVASVVSGDLRIAGVDAGATVRAVSGDIDLDAVAAGEIEIRSVSGDVTVGVGAGARVHVDVSTVSGDLTSEIELDEVAAGGAGPVVDIRGRTVSGDVRVRRAVAAT